MFVAGVYMPDTNEVFFTSNTMTTPNGSTEYTYPLFSNFSKISLAPDANGAYSWEVLTPPSKSFVLPNGGTFYDDKVLMVVQGYRLDVPSSIIAVNPKTLSAKVLLNNFYGRPFNSMNDIAVLMKSGGVATEVNDQWVFFTGKNHHCTTRSSSYLAFQTHPMDISKASSSIPASHLKSTPSTRPPVQFALLPTDSSDRTECSSVLTCSLATSRTQALLALYLAIRTQWMARGRGPCTSGPCRTTMVPNLNYTSF
jgi:hypothetical protein